MRLGLERIRRRLRDERGVTLAECLVVGFILVIGIAGGITVFVASSKTAGDAEHREIGTAQAERALEQMRAVSYANLKLTQPPAVSTGPDDPNDEVQGTQFQVRPSLLEDLVLPADPSGGTASVAPSSTFPLDTANSPVIVHVYRYVSWRDEECPTLDLSNLREKAEDTGDQVQAVNNSAGALIGSGGSLAGLSADQQATLTRPLGLLLGQVTNLLAPVGPIVNTLSPLMNALPAPLNAIPPGLQDLANSGQIDLCDVNAAILRKLRKLQTISNAMSQLAPALAQLQQAIAAVRAELAPVISANILTLLTKTTTAILNLPAKLANLTAAKTAVTNALAAISSDLSQADDVLGNLGADLGDAIDQILGTPETTHNTKRLTVAVVIETPAGREPPVWISSVVTDPNSGLLG